MLITVTGLPRSGTAFVSQLLQLHPHCLAYHELAAYRKDWREALKEYKWEADFVADCNTYGYLKEYDVIPDKRVYIQSSPSQSHQSSEIACKKKIDPQLMINLARIGEIWSQENDCLVIDRKKVFTLEGCRDIWMYCFDQFFPDYKVKELVKLNIQQHNAHVHFGEGSKFEL